MTLDAFRLLASRVQVTFTLMRGTYLAHRWEEKGKLMRYYLPDDMRGFFAELGHGAHDGPCFSDSEALADYAYRLRYEKAPTNQGFFYNLTA